MLYKSFVSKYCSIFFLAFELYLFLLIILSFAKVFNFDRVQDINYSFRTPAFGRCEKLLLIIIFYQKFHGFMLCVSIYDLWVFRSRWCICKGWNSPCIWGPNLGLFPVLGVRSDSYSLLKKCCNIFFWENNKSHTHTYQFMGNNNVF